MTDRTLHQQIEVATSYQDLLVPALMQEWAPQVADAASIRTGDRVLDVACGTGVLAREAASRAAPTGGVTGLDFNPGMLAVAAHLSPTLRWQQGTADALPFEDQSFEVVVSQFGLMFFPDPAAALREMLRVLVPSGRAGWVPDQFLGREGQDAVMLRDYTARELSVRAGADVINGEAINGWVWVTDADGHAGWIPETCVGPA